MKAPIYQPHIATLYNVKGDVNSALQTHNPMMPLPEAGPLKREYVMYGGGEMRRQYQDDYLGVVMTNLEENAYYSAENRGLSTGNQYYAPIKSGYNYGIGNYIGLSDTTTIYPDINTGQVHAHIKFY